MMSKNQVKGIVSQTKLVLSVKKGNQFAIPLKESLLKISQLLTKDSVLATNELDTEDTYIFHF